MTGLVRVSISLERPLYERLERLRRAARARNRSEFVRKLVRDRLVEQEWEGNEEALGTVTLVYDHERRQLSGKLTHLQHHHTGTVLAATHVHLDKHLCAEMIMLRGRAAEIRRLADELRQQKGVLHAALSMSSTGKKLA
jgi:CopG family nickel-responsive transcriptional regulator